MSGSSRTLRGCDGMHAAPLLAAGGHRLVATAWCFNQREPRGRLVRTPRGPENWFRQVPRVTQDLPGFRHRFSLLASAKWTRGGAHLSLGRQVPRPHPWKTLAMD